MNILVVSQYFWPEPFIINDLVQKIKKLGHEVTVFTGKPNYPDGEIYQGYTSDEVHQEVYQEDIPVYRIPLKPRKNGGAKNLILNYLSFIWSGLTHASKFSKNKQFDAILVYAPSPITSAIPAIFLKWLTKSHLSIWVQDLWPDSVAATGFIRNRFALKCVEGVVRTIYYFANTLLVQSYAFITPVSRLANKNKVIYYPNSAIDVQPSEKNIELPPELEKLLSNHFCLVFAGNIGIAQSIKTIVDAAIRLKHLPDIKLVLVGSGSMTDWVKQQIALHDLDNLILAGRFPPDVMPKIFSHAKALLVTLKRDEIFTYTIPSKIQSYLAAGRPIIAALDGEGARVIKEAEAGFASAAEDEIKLAENIEQFYHMPTEERAKLGQSGRTYFLENFEMVSQSQHLIEILEKRIKERRKSK